MVSFSYKALMWGSTVAALAMGCGGSGDISSNLVSAECGRLFRCAGAGADNDTVDMRLGYGSARDCVAAREGFDVADDLQQFIDAGTVVIDEAAAARCTAARRATCSVTVAETRACSAIVLGQVPAGGGCQRNAECASGACTGDGSEQCGTCGRLVATGEACRMYEDACEDGPNGEWGACSGGFCLLNGDGYPTDDAGLGEECGYYRLCEDGLFCEDGRCAAWRSLGDTCPHVLDSCGPGAYCRADGQGGGVCIPVRVESRAGDACGELDDERVVCSFAAGLSCSYPDGVCVGGEVERPEGEHCDVTSQCAEGLTCVGGECFGEPLLDGSECTSDLHCVSGSCRWRQEEPQGYVCQPPLICP